MENSSDTSLRKKPCRSCLDFKAWRAEMQGKANAVGDNVSVEVSSMLHHFVASLLVNLVT